MFESNPDDVLLQINVGVWMGSLSEDAYDHESTADFMKAIKSDVAICLDLPKVEQSLVGTLAFLGDTKGGYWNREREVQMRSRMRDVLRDASRPGYSVSVRSTTPLAGTCYPSEDGGWIRTRIYLLSRNAKDWSATNAVDDYIHGKPRPAKHIEDELRAIDMAVIAVFLHHHHE